jgi:hypothetical protein
LTTFRTGGLHRRYARRNPELVERWGPEAAAKYDRVGTLYSVGGLGSVAMLLVFMACSAVGWHGVAVAAMAVAFLVLVPLMFVAGVMMFSVTKQICRRYDIDPHSKPPLSLKALKSAGSFDGWLVAHGRQPPPARPFGSGEGMASR